MTNEPKRRGRPRKNIPVSGATLDNIEEMTLETVKTEFEKIKQRAIIRGDIPSEQQVDVSAKGVEKVEQPELPQATRIDTPAALKVYIYPKARNKPVGGIPRVIEAQEKHLVKYGIEIVETEDDADVIVCHVQIPPAFVKRFPRKPIVVINHGLYWSEVSNWKGWESKVNEEAMESIRVADRIITCSEWVANSIRRHTSRLVEVIPHGVDAEEWSLAENKGFVLWNKFREDPVCDPKPMNQVAAKMPDITFVSTFGAEAPNVKLAGELEFGVSKEVIRHAGVYLCTTRETFGIGTLEAMACGVPVVGFNFGGQADFIEHGVDGWLAKPGDIDGLAEGIRWAIANRETVGAAARRKAETYNWDGPCREYARIFREVYEQKTAQSSAPRTSIIVTNYNLHKYLKDCLDSVKNQTDQDWECIVVDDHSTNNEGYMLATAYAVLDKRFRVEINDKNVYLAEARNIGIRLARGRYILPLDADDMLAPNTVATLGDALDSDRSIHVAYGGVFFVDEDGITPTNYSGVYGKDSKFPPGKSAWPFPFVYEQQIRKMNLLPYASMYRKEAWRQVGGYRRRCRTAEDADLWVRLSSYGYRPKMVSDENTLIYRNREGSMSREQGDTDWIRWFSWSKLPSITPAGAITKEQFPIPSLDPVIISVIIPVGPTHERYVHDAIDSVDAQSFRNWECIVINDTGKPFEIELPSWVRVLTTEGKTGPAHARNVGISASRGHHFLPLDADDYLEPDALQIMLDASTMGEVVYCDFWQSDMTGQKTTKHETDDYDPELIIGKNRMVNGKVRQGMIHPVTALTPKAYWKQVGGYDETLPAWEDWDFSIALGNIGVCSRRVAMPLFFYRKHTGLRREENYASFDESKKGILNKWGDLWKEGGRKLMACGSCSRNKSVHPTNGALRAAGMPNKIKSDGANLIQYVGAKQGSTPWKGVSKTTYFFGAGDIKYVLAEDVPGFLAYSKDFRLVEQEAPVPSEPILVAAGPPQ